MGATPLLQLPLLYVAREISLGSRKVHCCCREELNEPVAHVVPVDFVHYILTSVGVLESRGIDRTSL